MTETETTDQRPPADRETGECFWCKETLYDAGKESGWTGEGPDWASGLEINGEWYGFDWGCDEHPITNEDRCGPHETLADVRAIVRKHHGDET
jgi:hypothetical protein